MYGLVIGPLHCADYCSLPSIHPFINLTVVVAHVVHIFLLHLVIPK